MLDNPKQALASALSQSAEAGLGFVNAGQYNQALALTFERTLSDVSRLGSNLKILEVGCFTCVVTLALKAMGHDLTASDIPFVIEDSGVRKLLDRAGIATLPADLSRLPFPAEDSSYDLIVFTEVLEHLNFNPIPLLREFHRILRPGGRVYCATPNLLAAKNRLLMLRGKSYLNTVGDLLENLKAKTGMAVGLHWREWSKKELIELFQAARLELEHHSFSLYAPNGSHGPRRHLVGLMYRLHPALMPCQSAVLRRSP